ncbi:hypothetical protein SDC9_117326 [bioreactor metagenome]|uniref:Uncharacterized protein n=1 Tax=bioreactor metagenome TaxID=1076179 RepID=A0A645C0B3_9ZZZZ
MTCSTLADSDDILTTWIQVELSIECYNAIDLTDRNIHFVRYMVNNFLRKVAIRALCILQHRN